MNKIIKLITRRGKIKNKNNKLLISIKHILEKKFKYYLLNNEKNRYLNYFI